MTDKELKIGWSPGLGAFLAYSLRCGLAGKGFREFSDQWWLVPRERALDLCVELDKEGAKLIWVGADLLDADHTP